MNVWLNLWLRLNAGNSQFPGEIVFPGKLFPGNSAFFICDFRAKLCFFYKPAPAGTFELTLSLEGSNQCKKLRAPGPRRPTSAETGF